MRRGQRQFAYNRKWPLFQVVETSGRVAGLIESARAERAELDPTLVLVEPEPLAAVLGRETTRDTFATLLVSVFAALDVSLAALGTYGILSYDVGRSRHEIGVRMALGAGAPEVRGTVARRGLALTAAGVGAGTLGALALSRALESFLFEVSPHDPRVVAAAALLVLVIGAVASWVPARRATAVEPAEAFRGREGQGGGRCNRNTKASHLLMLKQAGRADSTSCNLMFGRENLGGSRAKANPPEVRIRSPRTATTALRRAERYQAAAIRPGQRLRRSLDCMGGPTDTCRISRARWR